MNHPNRQGTWLREELLHLLPLSGILAGLCITGVTLFGKDFAVQHHR